MDTICALSSGPPPSGVAVIRISGPETAAKQLLRDNAKAFFETMLPLPRILRSVRFVVSHGGAGVTQAAMMNGLPQVIIPIHVESQINGLRTASLGSGLVVEPVTAQAVCDAVKTVDQVRTFYERASDVALDIGRLDLPQDPCKRVAEKAITLLDG